MGTTMLNTCIARCRPVRQSADCWQTQEHGPGPARDDQCDRKSDEGAPARQQARRARDQPSRGGYVNTDGIPQPSRPTFLLAEHAPARNARGESVARRPSGRAALALRYATALSLVAG